MVFAVLAAAQRVGITVRRSTGKISDVIKHDDGLEAVGISIGAPRRFQNDSTTLSCAMAPTRRHDIFQLKSCSRRLRRRLWKGSTGILTLLVTPNAERRDLYIFLRAASGKAGGWCGQAAARWPDRPGSINESSSAGIGRHRVWWSVARSRYENSSSSAKPRRCR